MTKKTNNTAEMTTSTNISAEDAHGKITIDHGDIAGLEWMSSGPRITEINIELKLPQGRDIEDVFIAKAERLPLLQDLATELAFTFGEKSIYVNGPIQLRGGFDQHQEYECELEGFYAAIEHALSALTKAGADVTLVPGLAHEVQYSHERGSHDEAALRNMYDFWRVNLFMEPQGLRLPMGTSFKIVKDERSFGWDGDGWTFRFTWIPRHKALGCRLASHALIRCEIKCEGHLLQRIQRCEEKLHVHEAFSIAGNLYRTFFDVCGLPDVVVRKKTVNIAGLISPWKFFFGEVHAG